VLCIIVYNCPRLIWENQGYIHQNKSIKQLTKSPEDCYIANWHYYLSINNEGHGKQSSKLKSYKLFKNSYTLENYLLDKQHIESRKEFTKLRISSHNLQIESDRYAKYAI
jgi:hypothetical protein